MSESVSGLPESYIEAMTVADYGTISGVHRVYVYGTAPHPVESLSSFPREAVDALSERVRSGDVDGSREAVKRLRELVASSDLSAGTVRLAVFDLVGTVFRSIRERTEKTPVLVEAVPDGIYASRLDAVGELLDRLDDFCLRVASAIHGLKESKNDVLADKIMRYIKANHDRYDFSVATMAGHFRISASYLSRFFKDHAGITVSDYVKEIKIETAKEIFGNTDKSIHSVGLEIGYLDASSFIKKFKYLEGTTPGEYRVLYSATQGRDE